MSLPHPEAPDPMTAALRSLIRAVVAEVLAEVQPVGPSHHHAGNLPPGVTARSFLDAIRRGELRAAKVGKRWVAAAADVRAWLDARAAQAPPPAEAPDVASVLAANGLQRGRSR